MHVVAAAIRDSQGRILLTKRHDHVHQGGLWEFPGGKVEAGEDVYAALKRELHEELGITPDRARPLIRVKHDYDDRSVLLDVWYVSGFKGEAHGREGQPLEWSSIEQLTDYTFPEANLPVIKALQLPPVYLISQSSIKDKAVFFTQLETALQAGIKLVQLRLKDTQDADFSELASETLTRCHAHGASLLLNADPDVAMRFGMDGVHLSSDRLMALTTRPLGQDKWVAASCHDALELAQAVRIGADFAVLSPVLPTKSHPGAETLGWEKFSALVDDVTIPVFALGGMDSQQLPIAHKHGAQGVAVLSPVWDSDDIEQTVREYLA